MKAIVAVDRNWGIGFKGALLKRIPEDMKNFKRLTLEKVVVMGRETFESLPGKKPLKDRTNIVLSKSADFEADGTIVCRSLEELFEKLKKYDPNDVFIIGGAQIYRQLLPFCTGAYVTRIDGAYEADSFFPRLDELQEWGLDWQSEPFRCEDVEYRFTRYLKKDG